jgi:glutamyl-tRNA reductase
MHVVAVGASHKTAPVSLREKIAFTAGHLPRALQALAAVETVSEAAILSTCNRTEIYCCCSKASAAPLAEFLCENRGVTHAELEGHTYHHLDEAAVAHLLLVAAGADSMAVGESQIVAQVREALEFARRARTAGPVVSNLFRTALHTGKHARSETGIARGAFSIGRCAAELACSVFDDLGGKEILILGAGEMAALTARHLVHRGAGSIVVTNRTHENAEQLARTLGGRAVPIGELHARAAKADILITSTAAPHTVLAQGDIKEIMEARDHAPLLIVDIAVPRDVDPRVRRMRNVHLFDIDDLQEVVRVDSHARREQVQQVRAIASEHAEQFMEWLRSLSAAPVVAALREKFEDVRGRELERHGRQLARMSPAERQVVERITRSIVNKLAHTPTVRMKHGLPQAAEMVKFLFDLDLAGGASGAE